MGAPRFVIIIVIPLGWCSKVVLTGGWCGAAGGVGGADAAAVAAVPTRSVLVDAPLVLERRPRRRTRSKRRR